MAMCNRCLKRGLFLKLDENGHCETCAREVIEEQRKKEEARRKEEERRRQLEIQRREQEARQAAEKAKFEPPMMLDGVRMTNRAIGAPIIVPDNCRSNYAQAKPGDRVKFSLASNYMGIDETALAQINGRSIGYLPAGEVCRAVVTCILDGGGRYVAILRNSPERPLLDIYFYGLPPIRKPTPAPPPVSSAADEKRELVAEIGDRVCTYQYDEGIFVPDDAKPYFDAVPDERRLLIRRDPSNQYDSSAIALTFGGKIVGYFYKSRLRDMVSDFLDPDRGMVVAIKNGKASSPSIVLSFYEDREEYVEKLIRRGNAKEFKLVATGGSEAQDALAYLSPADPVEVSENIEGQMEVCADGWKVIGRLPASAAKFIGDHEIAQARISENDYDPSTDKYSASVVILLKK